MGSKGILPIRFSGTLSSRYVVAVVLVFLCALQSADKTFGVAAEEDKASSGSNKNADSPVSHIRYRTRPVASFRSTKANNTNSTNSNETQGPGPSGVPFIAVHDLTSQTFDKLQENWKNVETFLRNLQVRRSQEESLRSSSGGDNSAVRRPPFNNNNNNVYSFKYHPVVLEGEGGGGNGREDSRNVRGPGHLGGNYFNPFLPYDPKESKSVDIERHTVTTIYTIGICLTIMAIGSVMFILINKCEGSGGSSYMRTTTAASTTPGGNRITRSVLGAATRAGRHINSGRSRNSRRGGNSPANNNENSGGSSGSRATSGAGENDAKALTDLPPSYASLFPEGGPNKQQEATTEQTSLSTAENIPTPTSVVTDNNVTTQDQNQNTSSASASTASA